MIIFIKGFFKTKCVSQVSINIYAIRMITGFFSCCSVTFIKNYIHEHLKLPWVDLIQLNYKHDNEYFEHQQIFLWDM